MDDGRRVAGSARYWRHGGLPAPAESGIVDRSTDAVVDVPCSGGTHEVTLNAIAHAVRCSPSQFHARMLGRSGMIEAVTHCFAGRWLLAVTNPYVEHGCWLPSTDAGRDGVRCWHGIRDLAYAEARAGRPAAADAVYATLQDEALHLAQTLRRQLGRRPTLLRWRSSRRPSRASATRWPIRVAA